MLKLESKSDSYPKVNYISFYIFLIYGGTLDFFMLNT
ncbi:unnamed protein product [Brassica oleracea]